MVATLSATNAARKPQRRYMTAVFFILGSARASRAGDGALAVADLFPMKDVMRRA